MLLAAFVSLKSLAVEVTSVLPHASIAKCRRKQVAEQLVSVSGCPIQFFGCREGSSGGDWLTYWLQSLHCGRRTARLRQPWGCHFAVWNIAEMTLEINLYEVTTPFERCVLETVLMETQGNSSRFWSRKCIKWVKKIVSSWNLLLLRREISLCGRATCNVNQMGIFWYFFILTS
jgi:hypothetical protein